MCCWDIHLHTQFNYVSVFKVQTVIDLYSVQLCTHVGQKLYFKFALIRLTIMQNSGYVLATVELS